MVTKFVPLRISLLPLAQDTYIHLPPRSLCIPTLTPKSKVFRTSAQSMTNSNEAGKPLSVTWVLIQSIPSPSFLTPSAPSTSLTLLWRKRYFRAPYGTDGALTRQRLQANVPGAKVINWSVDIQDWKFGETDTGSQQSDAVKADLAKGGNLYVAHYLYPSTVAQFRNFIQSAKGTGKRIMRIDQCLSPSPF